MQNRAHGALSRMVFNKTQSGFYRDSLSPTLVIFPMVLSSGSTNHLKFSPFIYIHLLIFSLYVHTHTYMWHRYVHCRRNLFTLSWKNSVVSSYSTPKQNWHLCFLFSTGVIFVISKKVYIFICIETCHVMKKS